MIEHAKCPRCGALAPLEEDLVMMQLEDDEPDDLPLYWQCRHCCITSWHRCEITIVALHKETRLPGLTVYLPGGWP